MQEPTPIFGQTKKPSLNSISRHQTLIYSSIADAVLHWIHQCQILELTRTLQKFPQSAWQPLTYSDAQSSKPPGMHAQNSGLSPTLKLPPRPCVTTNWNEKHKTHLEIHMFIVPQYIRFSGNPASCILSGSGFESRQRNLINCQSSFACSEVM